MFHRPAPIALPAVTEPSAHRPSPMARTRGPRGRRLALGLALLASACGTALAQVPTISQVPLSTTRTGTAKPNIMFILDDSGSMAWDYMPDDIDADGDQNADNVYGYKSAFCNGVAYNPAVTYSPPVRIDAATGAVSSYAAASFTAAKSNGYGSGTGGTNLTNSVYYKYIGTLPAASALSWSYGSNGLVTTSAPFYTQCMTAIPSGGAGNANFEKVTMSATSTDAQNYANWYSYYRTRQLTMRSAAGRAFIDLTDAYRVGFSKISDSSVTGASFLDPSDFNTAQKVRFFDLLYGTPIAGGTPLRAALSKIGRYYGGAITGQTDPLQYSCQRNYAVLSTDGYWNNASGYRLDGTTAIGQQDGDEKRPMQDGATSTKTTTITTSVIDRRTSAGIAAQTRTYQRTESTVATCDSGRGRRTTTQNQRRIETDTRPRTLIENVPSTTVRTIVETDGNPTSDSSRTTAGAVTTVSDTLGAVTSTAPGTWANNGGSNRGNCISPSSLATGVTTGPESQIATGAITWSPTPTPTVAAGTPTDPVTNVTTRTTGGDSNTLADVAEYYWKTDLRANLANNVPASGSDSATHQHMTTFTIGLGLKGTLTYTRNYLTQTSGDFFDLSKPKSVAGYKTWPVPSGTTGGDENATHIDDLWHAAVNGRGQYFSASDPNQLDDAISTTLNAIRRVTESGAAAAASTLTPVTGDDWVFLPSFTTGEWTGDLRAFKFGFDAVTKELIAPDTSDGLEKWSAAKLLNTRTAARRVLFNSGAGDGTPAALSYANLPAALKTAFDNRCSRATGAENLTQCPTLDATALTKVTGDNLVAYVAGNKTLYRNATLVTDQVFRTRNGLLGDIVNASPVYVGKPPFRYADAGYATHASSNAARAKMVYVAANDGLLHAFNVEAADTLPEPGSEVWAFAPSAVIPEMWRLASEGYTDDHRYLVDATPTVGDVYDSATGSWMTVLVGGLGAGGRSYYALNVTDPVNPKVLWEFTDTDLGYTYGNPVITKDKAGTWIVAFTSGTNNTAGDGVGRLYVLNAVTGARMPLGTLNGRISTGVGSASQPSNLGRLNGWVDSDTDNTATRFYAGDSLGNLWRFDTDDLIAPAGREAFKLGIAQSPDGTPQPITAKPTLSEKVIGSTTARIVSFGTGRLLTVDDLASTQVETIYAVKDDLNETPLGVLRSTGAGLVQQQLTSTRTVDPATLRTVDWATQKGWYVDLSVSNRERVHLDGVQLGAGVVGFASTEPTADVCDFGGRSYLYQFDIANGNVTASQAFTTMIVGLNRVMSSSGKVSAVVTTQNQKTTLTPSNGGSGSPDGSVRRSSWRELTD